MSRLADEIQDAIDAWFASGMKVRQQPIAQFVAERITALQSDSELLRALSREVIATCKTEYGMLPDDLLARLEQADEA